MPVESRAAVLFAPHEPLRIETVTVADPGPRDVLIRLDAASLCHSDLGYIDAKFPHPLPAILGHEGIGTVVRTGNDVTAVAEGDVVIPYLLPDCGECPYCLSGRSNFCVQLGRSYAPGFPTWFSLDGTPVHGMLSLGTFSEYLVVPQDQVQKVDAQAPRGQASCIGCGVTTGVGAAILTAKVEPGSSVVVFGMGGVGLSTVQGARIAGAATIIAVDLNPDKEAAARAMGATHFIAAGELDPVAEVRRITGIGADYAFECAGHPTAFQQGLASLSVGGWAKMTTVGLIPDDVPIPATWTDMSGRNWQHCLMGGAKRQDVAGFVDWFMQGKLDLSAMVSHEIALDEINHGFDLMRQGKVNRAVIRYSDWW
jgi:S-(hydroxymethyl)glutathione dehydrogenase/alcohol dehydrogenase